MQGIATLLRPWQSALPFNGTPRSTPNCGTRLWGTSRFIYLLDGAGVANAGEIRAKTAQMNFMTVVE